MPRPPSLQSNDHYAETLVRAAWLYYIQALTQQEIAARLGISRVKVTRLLQQAKAAGLVTVTLHSPAALYLQVAEDLRRKFGLEEAVVTVEPEDSHSLIPLLANAAANFLAEKLRPGLVIGLGIGRTIGMIPQFFQAAREVDCTFTELTGGTAASLTGYETYDVCSRLAMKAGGQAAHIYAPFLVVDQAAFSGLLTDPAVEHSLALARQASLALVGLGAFDDSNAMHQMGVLSREESQRLKNAGAIGDLLGRFFDDTGIEVASAFSERLVGLSLAEFQSIPQRIVVAGGESKAKSLLAALKGKLVNGIITDVKTARMLLAI